MFRSSSFRRSAFPLLLAAVLVPASAALGQALTRLAPRFPDAAGYRVLVADLHMHTIHSDGRVTPEIRIKEGYRDGLDVIALTDHLERYMADPAAAAERAKDYRRAAALAEKLGLIYLWGGEITKSFPEPGHFVAYFISDPAAVLNEDYLESAREAVRQGGIVHWAHPGQEWTASAEKLYKEGLLAGVEVDNMTIDPDTWGTRRYRDLWFYPVALDWCLSRKLSPVAATDAHEPLPPSRWGEAGYHRSVTLVLASERSAASVREAFVARRTVACFNDMLWGDSRWLEAIWRSSLDIPESLDMPRGGTNYLRVANRSAFPFRFQVNCDPAWISIDRETILEPGAETPLGLSCGRNSPAGETAATLSFTPLNLYAGIDRNPVFRHRLRVRVAGGE